jgi:hypothetical protein
MDSTLRPPASLAPGPAACVTISRNSPDDIHQRQVIVKLDGVKKAELLYGDSVTVPIEPGHHKVVVDNTWNWKTAEFDAVPGEHVRFRTVNKTGHWGWFLLSAFGVGLIVVSLEREK